MKKLIGIIMILTLIMLTGCNNTRDDVKTYLHDIWELEESYELVEKQINEPQQMLDIYLRDEVTDINKICDIGDKMLISFVNGEKAANLLVDKNKEFKQYIIMNGKSMEQKGFDTEDLLEEVRVSIIKYDALADGYRDLQRSYEKINTKC